MPLTGRYSSLVVSNPKRVIADTKVGRASWYPYYAGFSPSFAQNLLASAKLKGNAVVVDPWNGGGTTTAAATLLGIKSIGSDLNPVMIVAAKAYLLSKREINSLPPLSSDICKKASFSKFQLNDGEPLLTWFHEKSALHIRNIEAAIQNLLVSESTYVNLSAGKFVEELSDIAAFFILALFRTTRHLLKPFYSSNPTWLKRPKNSKDKIELDAEIISNLFRSEVNSMANTIGSINFNLHEAESSLYVSSSELLPIGNETSDFILTSPPYCTRIDYAVATMAELAVLGMSFDKDLKNLRNQLIGTSTIVQKDIKPQKIWGAKCNDFLEKIEYHDSVSSASYYKKNHLQYFDSIFNSMSELARIMKKSSLCSIVVQDSHYKEIHNDLPSIFTQMGSAFDLKLVRRDDFKISQSMAGINPAVRKYRTKVETTESVLTFSK